MSSDPDRFLLRAIRARRTGDTGEDVPPDQVDDFAVLERIGGAVTDGDPVELVEPPPDLWARIESATAPADRSELPEGQSPTAGTGAGGASIGLGRRRTRRRAARRRPVVWLSVAAAVLLVVVAATLLSRDGRDDDVVASAELEQLVETGTAEATLVRLDDGQYRLDLEVDGVEPDGGFLELWLLGPGDGTDDLRLISLGVVNQSGSYPLPAGLELSAFPIVDISTEPFDGDPSHSGNSLLRGELSA
jgi:Anti-sigma-K factor rskA